MRDCIVYDNFPDEVWSRLKAWAKLQAAGEASPTSEECGVYVRRMAKDITGDIDALRPDVVTFYAAETIDMIARFRQQLLDGRLQSAFATAPPLEPLAADPSLDAPA